MSDLDKLKRILFVTPVVPLPPTGGGNRSFHVLRSFAEEAMVDLICFQQLSAVEEAQLRPYCNQIISAPPITRFSNGSFFYKLFRKLIFPFPFLFSAKVVHDEVSYQLNQFTNRFFFLRRVLFFWLFFWLKQKKNYPSVVMHLFSNLLFFKTKIKTLPLQDYQILVLDLSYTFSFFQQLTAFRFPTVIINSHNIEYELIQQSDMRTDSIAKRMWTKWQTFLMKETEQQGLQIATDVFCCSDNDKGRFIALEPQTSCTIVPNGVDTDYFKATAGYNSVLPLLLFSGTMNYYPNIEGVRWFLKEVFLPLKKQLPQLRFIIAGRSANIFSNEQVPAGVEVVSDPSDMRPYFDKAHIVVVPLFHGSGTRLKILEAAAMKKPVVSTRLGAAGLTGLKPEMISFAENAKEFAQTILLLLADTEQRSEKAVNLHIWVTEQYSWNSICLNLKNHLRKYLN